MTTHRPITIWMSCGPYHGACATAGPRREQGRERLDLRWRPCRHSLVWQTAAACICWQPGCARASRRAASQRATIARAQTVGAAEAEPPAHQPPPTHPPPSGFEQQPTVPPCFPTQMLVGRGGRVRQATTCSEAPACCQAACPNNHRPAPTCQTDLVRTISRPAAASGGSLLSARAYRPHSGIRRAGPEAWTPRPPPRPPIDPRGRRSLACPPFRHPAAVETLLPPASVNLGTPSPLPQIEDA